MFFKFNYFVFSQEQTISLLNESTSIMRVKYLKQNNLIHDYALLTPIDGGYNVFLK
jgi:hypothetical protein